MASSSDRLREYLDSEESLAGEFTATLSENSGRVPVSVGITDRRLLCVSEDNRMISIGYSSISAIRSRSKIERTYRGIDYRLLAGFGSFLAVAGIGGVLAFSTSFFVVLFALLTVGGFVSAEYLRRSPGAVERAFPDRYREDGFLEEKTDGLLEEKTDGLLEQYELRRYESRITDRVDEYSLLVAGGGFVGLVLLGVAVITLGILVSVSVLVVVCGITLIDYAYRRRDDFDGTEVLRQPKTEVIISTVGGSTIYLRSDPSEEIDQTLSRLVVTGESNATPDAIPVV